MFKLTLLQILKLCLRGPDRRKLASFCRRPQVQDHANSKKKEVEQRIVEQYPASLAYVEYFPVVSELLVAESPAEDILR